MTFRVDATKQCFNMQGFRVFDVSVIIGWLPREL